MSPVQTGAPPVEDAPSPTGSLQPARHRGARPAKQVGDGRVGILAVFVFLALFGPLLIDGDPKAKVGEVFEPPSREFPLGTDGGGPSMLSLLVAGARVSLLDRLLRGGDLGAHRRDGRHALRVLRREDGHGSRCGSPTTSS